MKICMAGACGRMGRRILELAAAADDLEIGGVSATGDGTKRDPVEDAELPDPQSALAELVCVEQRPFG